MIYQDISTGAGPAIVTFVSPSTVVAVLSAVSAANAMPVSPVGISAVATPFRIVTFEYMTGFAWFTQPTYNFCVCETPDAVNVMDVGGVFGAVETKTGSVRLRDGKIGSGRSCGQDRGSTNVSAML